MLKINSPEPSTDWERSANWDHKYRHQNMSVDVDVWYPMLKSLTVPTIFVNLSHQEVTSILHYYAFRLPNKQKDFTSEDTKVLKNLEKKLDTYLQNPIFSNGAMFRLTGRSSKDGAPYNREQILNVYLDNLKKMEQKLNKKIDKDINAKYNCIPFSLSMKVKTGKEVLSLLLSSERIYHDLRDWEKHGGRDQIVFRKWVDELEYSKEFRGFVFDGKLKAICQYDKYGLVESNIKNRELYEKMIHDFYNNKLKPLMKIPTYSVDFGILNDKEVFLIEFSPFLRCTSARLFRWENNNEEMTGGDGKLTVRTEEATEMISYYVDEWENIYKHPFEDFEDYYITETYFQMIKNYLNPFGWYNYFFGKNDNNKNYVNIFVCSVLKDKMYWNNKYISYDGNENKLLGKGMLKDHCIIVDKNGFGWIKSEKGKKCYGEIYEVAYDDYVDINYFYDDGNKKMGEIEVENISDEDNKENKVKVFAYVIDELNSKLNGENNMEVEEYDSGMESKLFNPMMHVINREERYLNMSLDFNLLDGW